MASSRRETGQGTVVQSPPTVNGQTTQANYCNCCRNFRPRSYHIGRADEQPESRQALSIVKQSRLDHRAVHLCRGEVNVEIATFNRQPLIRQECRHQIE